jgi:hypothetical protein
MIISSATMCTGPSIGGQPASTGIVAAAIMGKCAATEKLIACFRLA